MATKQQEAQVAETQSDNGGFVDHLEKASSEVDSWPEWKRSLLGAKKAEDTDAKEPACEAANR